MIPDTAAELERVLKLLEFTSPAPWDLDMDVMRGDDALGICRFDWEDEHGNRVYAVSRDADERLIAAAPDTARLYAEALGELERMREALETISAGVDIADRERTASPFMYTIRKIAAAALAPAPEGEA